MKNKERLNDFHDWADEHGYYLNDGEDLHRAIPNYEEFHGISGSNVEAFWESSPGRWMRDQEVIELEYRMGR